VVRLGLLSTAAVNGAILGARGDGAPFTIDAVSSRSPSRAEAYARELEIARWYASYEELLADPRIDAVYVALPNALHHEWTMRALHAGKHVLVEKPYTRRPEQVDEAWDLAEAGGLVLQEAFMWRHSAQTRLFGALLPRVGEVQGLHATFFGILPRDADVRLDPHLGGGALLDLGCYCVNAARLVLGEPSSVHGEPTWGGTGVDVRFAGTLRFGDTVATFACGFAARHNRVEVVGADGVLVLPEAFVDPPGLVLLNGDEHRVDAGNHYRAQLDHFCAAIRGEVPPIPRSEMLGQARTLDALLGSTSC
jgi:xylose dehydrogenase (NAD/NADP)